MGAVIKLVRQVGGPGGEKCRSGVRKDPINSRLQLVL